MDYQFAVSDQPAQPVLSKRTVIPVSALPQELGKAYREIITYLGEIGEMAAVDSALRPITTWTWSISMWRWALP